MSVILGINSFHADASAALFINGKLVFAIEEERLSRIKHHYGFPSLAIKKCLQEFNLKVSDVDIVSLNSKSTNNLLLKVFYSIKNLTEPSFIRNGLETLSSRISVENQLNSLDSSSKFSGKIIKVDHHEAHLFSSHISSGFDQSIGLSIDGMGDFSSTTLALIKNTTLKYGFKIKFPHSMGIFYEAMTHYLGFKRFGDEYKVMGLAPYGKPIYLSKLNDVVQLNDNGQFRLNLDYFVHHKGQVSHNSSNGSPSSTDAYSSALIDLLGPDREPDSTLSKFHMDIARSTQAMYEKVFFHVLNHAYEKYGENSLTISGGCGNNSVANGKIYRNTPFKRVYIASSCGDAGGAIGAGYGALIREGIKIEKNVNGAYLGSSFSDKEIESVLKDELPANSTQFIIDYYDKDSDLFGDVAKSISEGNVVGWFQGSMEWGPRALGNRSILGDPRRDDMKDILNIKIKRRESFRPFAPSILKEHVSDWFEEDDDVPYMMKVFQILESKQNLIPAVTHVDGSGRLQTVSKLSNSRYYQLISCFYEITQVPILLNTSFNENEPVVCHPKEALACFQRTKMDMLVMGNWMIKRST